MSFVVEEGQNTEGAARRERANDYLGDPEIRSALINYLSRDQKPHSGCVLIEELGLCRGQVRLDLGLVSGRLHGFEIKSDRDTLVRIDRQIDFYNRVVDRMTLVVGLRYQEVAEARVPEWWGILTAEKRGGEVLISERRAAGENPAQDIRSLAELLWLDDAMQLLDSRNAARGYRGKPRRIIWDRICEVLSPDEIGFAVRAGLRARTTGRVLQQPL